MNTSPRSIRVDRCYRTKADLVRLITKIEGDEITYAPRGQTAFDNWHETAPRLTIARRRFLSEAVEEIPYYWQPEEDEALPAEHRSRADLLSRARRPHPAYRRA